MTNEEIRLNHFCKHCPKYDEGCDYLCRGSICDKADAYESGLYEKDQQFKEFLDKKIKEQSENMTDEPSCREMVECVMAEAIYQEIINELFKED